MQHRPRSARLFAALAAALLIAGVVAIEVSSTRGEPSGEADPAPAPEGSPLPAPTAEGEPDTPPAPRPTPSPSEGVLTQPTSATVHWDATLAIALPVSSTHGPAALTSTTAAGFARTRLGAAMAAAHLLARTSPRVGPDVFTPTLEAQVRGPNRTALAEAVRAAYTSEAGGLGLLEGAPLPGADAEVVGYRVVRYADTDAAIEVVLSSTALRVDAQLVAIRVSLQWADGDWQLLAPPRGDWATVTTVMPRQGLDVVEYDGTA